MPEAPAQPNRDTPAMRQHARFKREHPGCILFFRLGDFYEMFDEDALSAHRILGITLTQRSEGIPMAGIPFHSAEGYLKRLVEAGERVAVCEQMQDPKDAKGIVERAVVRVVTPGTRIDESLLDAGWHNEVAAVAIVGSEAALALIELSTGRFTVATCPALALPDEIARRAPAELVFAEGAALPSGQLLAQLAKSAGIATTSRPPWSMGTDEAGATLRRHFAVASVSQWRLEGAAVAAAGGLLAYLLETQSGMALDGASGASARLRTLAHLEPPQLADRAAHVMLDAWTMRALELERTALSGSTEGTLRSMFSHARTPMGRRLLRDWLAFPLRDRHAIEGRQAAVAALVQDAALREALTGILAKVQDVARIHGRVAMRRATPRDLVALGRSIASSPRILELVEGVEAFGAIGQRLADASRTLAPLGTRIVRACVDDPPAHLREGGLFRDGNDGELDEARTLERDAGAWLAKYQADLVRDTGIDSLRTGFNRVFGYYIEVTHAHTAKVPISFTRRQTLRNAERYITPELKEFEDKVLGAERRAIDRERALFDELLDTVADHGAALVPFADAIAELDCLSAFADAAVRHGYVRPVLCDEPILVIEAGRHPVLDERLGGTFVANDCELGGALQGTSRTPTLALVTGPNMAGKSTYIRQNALISIMALSGSFVPAKRATVGVCDRIFARIGGSDEIQSGRSTFMVEMSETANILHHATASSLVILDEIGRGTSTLDGLSLAWAITEALAARRTRTLFATHYHELTALADDDPSIGNVHVAVREWKDEVVFLHRIEKGRSDRSYGIHVAKLAGVPRAVVERAREVLERLAVHAAPEHTPSSQGAPAAPTLFDLPTAAPPAASSEDPARDGVLAELAATDVNALTPLEAFDLLRRWKGRLGPPATGA